MYFPNYLWKYPLLDLENLGGVITMKRNVYVRGAQIQHEHFRGLNKSYHFWAKIVCKMNSEPILNWLYTKSLFPVASN